MMYYYRNTAIIVGILFITATVTSILSSIFLGSTLTAPISFSTINANANNIIIAVILELIAALSAFGTAVMLFPILKKYTEGLAIAYVGLRVFENAFYILGAISLLILLTLSQQNGAFNNVSYQLLSNLVLALHDWSLAIGTVLIFGIGSLTLNYILYQSKLVPRWISIWGLIGAALVLLYGLIGIFSLDPNMISSILTVLVLPIAVQEMVFAVWLIVKGFNPHCTCNGSK
jgi:Domain of unknown function (DUF4386)